MTCVRREVINWLREGRADYGRAVRALDSGDYALSVFMSQQACEKALKAAYIALLRTSYPRTHDLVALYRGLESHLKLPNDVVERLPEVSQYYVTARYPNAGLEAPSESISREQAVRALEVAEAVLSEVETRVREGGDPRLR